MFLNVSDIVEWEYVHEDIVHDIEVSDTHNYFLQVGDDEILVHNSSKTYSIMQLICKLCIENRYTVHIVSEDFPALYVGAIADLKALILDSEILRASLVNPSLDKGPFKFRNGSVIIFKTVSSAHDAKVGKRDILFINEAQSLPWDRADELISRTKERVFIDYNPNARFWVHSMLAGREDVKFIISNFSNNKFCPPKTIQQIMRWKRLYDMNPTTFNKNKWFVMGLGLTGTVEGVVFDDVLMCTFFPLAAKHVIYGLDFGFNRNHTALVKLGVYNKAVYGKEILYEQRLNSFQLADKLVSLGITKEDKIIADPANDEAITILQRKGFNIVPAKKGNDSIKAGIELIQSMPLYVTYDSTNWLTEAQNYKYKKDKNGHFTSTPIDDFNDCFVAGTKVLTITGPKPIETIQIGEQVLTSEGYNTVVHTWDNGIREVSEYTLIFEDREIVVTCTDKHKIKTSKGWKQIQELQEQDILYLCKDSTERSSCYTQTKDISIGIVNQCTKLFGNSIMEKCPKDFMYTILMRTPKIMISKISHWLKVVNICLITPKRGLKDIGLNFMQQVLKLLRSGIKVKKDPSGIKSMPKYSVLESKLIGNEDVITVEQDTPQTTLPICSVPINANQLTVEPRELITKPENVVGAVLSSSQTNTQKFMDVQSHALISIQKVNKGSLQVYDLMVENCHEYFVGNQFTKLLVSNCWDAARYGYVELFGLRRTKAEATTYNKGYKRKSTIIQN
jgi:phage terminase large subunit